MRRLDRAELEFALLALIAVPALLYGLYRGLMALAG
jgi:hypothetical protein